MARKSHIHKYYKRAIGSQTVWACALDDCNHFMPVHLEDLVRGKRTLCWNYGKSSDCEKTTIIDDRTWLMDKPLCATCDPNAVSSVESIEEILNRFNTSKATEVDAGEDYNDE